MLKVKVLQGFWRESARPARIFFMSAYVVGPLMLFLLHIRYWTLGLLLVTIAAMSIIERFGYTPPVAILAIRAWFAGKLVKRRKSFFNKRLDN
ncbi:intracellular multiplication protein IcmT [Roseateles asaccharophilus]|uniref:IcmT/TraK family protein n=1 Tax=Roseateles asaccharophilus TaxID=582607 RepID=UPI0038370963